MAVAKKGVVDKFANLAAIYIAESAANTQTTAKFAFPFSIMDKMGLLITRIEYWVDGLGGLNSTEDRTTVGISAASSIVSIANQADPLLIDSHRIVRYDIGAAASGFFDKMPFIKDFSQLPGGGLLVAPAPLYGIIQSVGASAALAVWVKLFYTYLELNTDEYWQLVESRRVISS